MKSGALSIFILMALPAIITAHPKKKYNRDVTSEPGVFSSTWWPSSLKLAPSIGNGHLATNVFSDTVFMNGFYNGQNTSSHRARIPSWANVRLKSTLYEDIESLYSLDTNNGVFITEVNKEEYNVIHKVYAHRYYTRAIINQITVERRETSSDESVELIFDEGSPSTDLTVEELTNIQIGERQISGVVGKTLLSENEKYQPNPSEVYVYWTPIPETLPIPISGKVTYTYVMVADKDNEVSLKEIEDVLSLDTDSLYDKHITEWNHRHSMGNIVIEGNSELSDEVKGAWYYLLSSLPSYSSNQPHNIFYGLSPGSLATGGYDSIADTYEGYRGHSFWDTETWMYPPVLVLYPDLAKALLNYRLAMKEASKDNAELSGHDGIRFAWESAFTGMETSPAWSTGEYEQHITGCIAFAIRQYIAMTRDEDFLKNDGCDVIKKIAQFWASRVMYNDDTGFYDIHNVMGPDEYYGNISNSVFTNVVAGYSLYLGQYASCLCSSIENDNEEVERWVSIAQKISYLYDDVYDYHPEFSSYQRLDPVKQADVILLAYPLQYPMNGSTFLNDLQYYESVTDGGGPAMSWGMFTIGYLQNDLKEKADELFEKSYLTYSNAPFRIWSENNKESESIGAVNFITGMGGFLQTIMFGYGGIRIHLDGLEIKNPQLPPRTTQLAIKGISYLGAEINLAITEEAVTFEIVSTDNDWPLTLQNNGDNTDLYAGQSISLNLQNGGSVFIRTTNDVINQCELPLDLIGQLDDIGKK